MKKGMIFPTIVKAIIALVVLLVLIAIFTGKIGMFEQNTGSCGGKGGVCSSNGECSGPVIFTKDCTYYDDDGNINKERMGQCCLKT